MVDLLLRFRSAVLAVLLVAGAAVMPSSRALADDAADIDRMAQSTLETLYAQKPSAARAVREAAGYAVFSDISTKILLAGGGGGKGVAVDNRSGAKTYMLMATVSAGLGLGISKSHLVCQTVFRPHFSVVELNSHRNLERKFRALAQGNAAHRNSVYIPQAKGTGSLFGVTIFGRRQSG